MAAPTASPHPPLSPGQQRWRDAACAQLDATTLRKLLVAMVDIPSPTGEERRLAEFLVEHMRARGLDAAYQGIAEREGNATARFAGDGSGASLLLYAPIDTHLTGNARDDVPWVGETIRPDMLPYAIEGDDYVMGLCAENPKGYAAAVVVAAEAIRIANVPLRGDLLVGLAAGGMPTNKPPGAPSNAGHGAGCAYLLEHGFRPDYAVIAKGGWAIAYEEVGLCWFRIRVHGGFNYAGIRHRLPLKNAIVEAAKVIVGLEAWFPEYSKRNASGLCDPQGQIGAIAGGWPYKPAFSPEYCELYVDLRITPRTTPNDAQRQIEEALAQIRAANHGLEVSCEMIAAIPGVTTPPENWIIRSGIAAWEIVANATHAYRMGTSGATDANILRGHGVPTARVGPPPARPGLPYEGTFSMGVAEVDGLMQLARILITIAIDTCTRSRDEL